MSETRSNRRRHPRVRGRGLEAHLESEAGRTAAVVENISLGGVFVRTDQPQEAGAELTIELLGPDWKRPLSLAARVTSRVDALASSLTGQPTGMGLQFVRLEDDQFDRLRRLIVELGAPEKAASADGRARDGRDAQPQASWKHVEMVEQAMASALKESRAAADAAEPRAPSLPHHPRGIGLDALASGDVQVRSLLLELSEAQQQIAQRDEEIQRLRVEVDVLRGALARAVGSKSER